jgi:hypothetical protein
MRSLRWSAAGALLCSVAVGWFYGGCGDDVFTGGKCEVDSDCQSEWQIVPYTHCENERCTCDDPTLVICCDREATSIDCLYLCRPCAECAEWDEKACSAEPTDCQSDDECPGPPDPQCGKGRCVEGACQVEIHPGLLTSQLRGDCQLEQCSETGEVVAVYDPSDYYDDGERCTSDFCTSDGPQNEPLTDGVTCPVVGSGLCHEGTCVECYAGDPNMIHCPTGNACDGTLCVPLHCVNNQLDVALGETDNDCGGPCTSCSTNANCANNSDCLDRVCEMDHCKLPTCDDGVRNDAETGVDCGAPSCPLCGTGEGCETGANCASGVCWTGECEAPTCLDGVRNGGETGIDCGGPCEPCP